METYPEIAKNLLLITTFFNLLEANTRTLPQAQKDAITNIHKKGMPLPIIDYLKSLVSDCNTPGHEQFDICDNRILIKRFGFDWRSISGNFDYDKNEVRRIVDDLSSITE